MMEINRATREDIPRLCELIHSLLTQEKEFEANDEMAAEGLLRIIGDPDTGDILVARSSDGIIAMVNLLYTVSTALGGRVCLLEDMIVASEARSLGVGSTLISYAMEYAKEKGCQRITLFTDGDNERAQQFYDKHGFTRSSMVLFRKLLKK